MVRSFTFSIIGYRQARFAGSRGWEGGKNGGARAHAPLYVTQICSAFDRSVTNGLLHRLHGTFFTCPRPTTTPIGGKSIANEPLKRAVLSDTPRISFSASRSYVTFWTCRTSLSTFFTLTVITCLYTNLHQFGGEGRGERVETRCAIDE